LEVISNGKTNGNDTFVPSTKEEANMKKIGIYHVEVKRKGSDK
jgi:hypothetical protein